MSISNADRSNNRNSFGDKTLLASYALFAFVAAAVSIAMLLSPQMANHLLPHLGWPIVGLSYLGSLIFVAVTWLYPNILPLAGWWGYLRGHFLIIIVYGLITTAMGWIVNDFGNPYLTVSIWQPIWTILTPSLWMLLFYRQTHHTSTPR